ncbi:MAG: hypothetical protein ACO1SV_17090 [Fimbriimonas sp.]
MRSFRVHASAASAQGRIPYLVLTVVGGGRIAFDFSAMETEPRSRVAPVTLTSDALYEVLEGRELTLRQSQGTITLFATEDELNIHCRRDDASLPQKYRVWIAEVALGWNMLTGAIGSAA